MFHQSLRIFHDTCTTPSWFSNNGKYYYTAYGYSTRDNANALKVCLYAQLVTISPQVYENLHQNQRVEEVSGRKVWTNPKFSIRQFICMDHSSHWLLHPLTAMLTTKVNYYQDLMADSGYHTSPNTLSQGMNVVFRKSVQASKPLSWPYQSLNHVAQMCQRLL